MLTGVIKGIVLLKLVSELGAENYAFLSQFLVIGMVGGQLLIANFDAPLISDIAAGRGNTAARSVALLILLNSLLLSSVFFLWPTAISSFIWGDEKYAIAIPLILALMTVQALSLSRLAQLQGQKNFHAYTRYQITQQLAQLAAVAISIRANQIIYVAYAIILAELIVWAIFSCIYLPLFSTKKETILVDLRWIFRYSKVAMPLLGTTFLIWLITNGGRMIAVNQTELRTLAMYSATLAIAVLSSALTNPLCTVFFPYFSAGKDKEAQQALIQAQWVLLGSSTLLSVGLICVARPAVNFLAGEDFYAGPAFTFWICAGYVFYGQARILGLYKAVNGTPTVVLRAYLFGAGLFLIIAWIAGMTIGINGIAMAFCISCFTMCILLKLKMQHEYKQLARSVSFCLLAAPFILLGASTIDFSNLYTSIPGAGIISAVTLMLFYALATKDETESLKKLLKGMKSNA